MSVTVRRDCIITPDSGGEAVTNVTQSPYDVSGLKVKFRKSDLSKKVFKSATYYIAAQNVRFTGGTPYQFKLTIGNDSSRSEYSFPAQSTTINRYFSGTGNRNGANIYVVATYSVTCTLNVGIYTEYSSSYSPYCMVELEDIKLTPNNLSPMSFFDAKKRGTLSWDYDRKNIDRGEDGVARSQKSAVIEWKGQDGTVHTVNVSGSLTFHNFAENTFPANSTFDWRVKIISDDDVEGDFSSWVTVSTIDSAGTVRALSPDNTIIDADLDNRFSWIYTNPYGTEPSGYEIEMSSNKGESWRQIKKETTSDCYADIPAGTLPAGNIMYRVRAYSQSGYVSEWETANVTVRKHPEIPSIYQVEASTDRPTVSWESNGQEAYELEIIDSGGKCVYSHYAATADYSHKIAARLDNGQYTAQLVTWNSFGLESLPASRQFSVMAEKPTKPVMSGMAQHDHNALKLSSTTSKAVLLRNGVVIADVSGTDSYYDYTAPCESIYRLRSLSDTAFCDSDPVAISNLSRYAMIVLASDHSTRATLIYKQGSPPERSSSLSSEYALLQLAGRRRPVAEYGDQMTRTKSLSYSLRNIEDLKALQAMVGNTVIWSDRQDHMISCLSALSWNTHQGYTDVSFTLTEVDGDEGIEYE